MIDILRGLANQAIEKQMYDRAIMLIDLIMQTPFYTISDIILSAKCFFLNGESRRCLACIEAKGFLNIENIHLLTELFPDKNITADSNEHYLLVSLSIASKSLFTLDQYEDCIVLLGPILQKAENLYLNKFSYSEILDKDEKNLKEYASILVTAGRCLDMLENRSRSIRMLLIAIEIDTTCVEALDYIVQNSLLNSEELKAILDDKLVYNAPNKWLLYYHKFLIDKSNSDFSTLIDLLSEGEAGESDAKLEGYDHQNKNTTWNIQRAEKLYYGNYSEEAYQLSRQSYSMDPFNNRGLCIYIACLVDLNLKNELFYLGHELSQTNPKSAITWYVIGCYYWCCKKYESAQKFLQKSTRIDKRFSQSWILLGMVLSAQEESEHAISAFRAAARLLPGDYRPLLLKSKELLRTGNISLARQILMSIYEMHPTDPILLNELGIVVMKSGRLSESLMYFRKAIALINKETDNLSISSTKGNYPQVKFQNISYYEELYSNYATCLRSNGELEESLKWYEKCLSINSNNPHTLAHIGFTLHLSKRIENAILYYHRALAVEPTLTVCSELLNKALSDLLTFSTL